MTRLGLLALLPFWIGAAFGADAEVSVATVSEPCVGGCKAIVVTGEITQSTVSAFSGPDVDGATAVLLSAHGEDFAAGMEFGRAIRSKGLNTYVSTQPAFDEVEHAACTGACAWAFLGGLEREEPLSPAELIFERPASASILASLAAAEFSGRERLADQATIGLLVNYLVEMNVDPELMVAISRVEPGQALRFDKERAHELGIYTSDQRPAWELAVLGPGLMLRTASTPQQTEMQLFCDSDGFIRLRVGLSPTKGGKTEGSDKDCEASGQCLGAGDPVELIVERPDQLSSPYNGTVAAPTEVLMGGAEFTVNRLDVDAIVHSRQSEMSAGDGYRVEHLRTPLEDDRKLELTLRNCPF